METKGMAVGVMDSHAVELPEVDSRVTMSGVSDSRVSDSKLNSLGAMDRDQKRVIQRRAGNIGPKGEKHQDGLPELQNRVREIAWHIPWYSFKAQARLAEDSGVSPAAISRLIRGQSQPTLPIALRVTTALSRRLERPLDVFEVFSLDGSFPTPSVCHLTGCRNCLPPTAYDREENLLPAFQGVHSGNWDLTTLNRQEGR